MLSCEFTNLVRVAFAGNLGDDPATMNRNESPADSFLRFLQAAMPEGLAQSVNENLRAAASSAFEKMDLVSREELDVQQRVLLRTREKLEALEKQVAELEKKLLK
jgi:hypothetical protein